MSETDHHAGSLAWRQQMAALERSRAGRRPRARGLTMLLDRCLGLRATEDLLELAGDFIDQVKLSFGTAILIDERLLQDKIGLLRAHGITVYPGGTLTELAISRGHLSSYVCWLRDLGFDAVEISDGTVDLARGERHDAIRRARDAGLTVLTEVGKKDPARQPEVAALCDQIEADLEWGAWKVLIEARESGRGIGIYGSDASVDRTKLSLILDQFAGREDRVIFEAPRVQQQSTLIRSVGPWVNLGNIKPRDALGLEALRRGLRFETFQLPARDEESALEAIAATRGCRG